MKTLFTILFSLSALLASAQANCSAPATGFTPINDLGASASPVTGLMGGLYPNGSNFIPPTHKIGGLQMASQVECLNANGIPDAVNGKIVWLSIGMSNCTQETQQFMPQANAFVGKNPKLTLVDGAQGGQTAQIISSSWSAGYANFWTTVGTRLSNAGVTANQVQIIWLKEANQAGTTLPQVYYDSLVIQLKRISNELKTRFPNVKLCYLASRISARYATTTLNPEPYSYWTGWAVKKVITDQINGDAQLAYSGNNAKAPWLSWGIYMWSDGSTPQSSDTSVYFVCPTDYQNDGTHPSTIGAQKVGAHLLKFFSTDSTCTPWFLGAGCTLGTSVQAEDQENDISFFPNPSNRELTIYSPLVTIYNIQIYDVFGKLVFEKTTDQNREKVDLNMTKGVYFLKVEDKSGNHFSKIVVRN